MTHLQRRHSKITMPIMLYCCIICPTFVHRDPPPDANVATAACKLTLPLEGGCYCSVNATILRSTLNTVTVYLKPETLVVNRCPLTIRLVEAMNEEDEEESRMRITDLAPMDVGILVHKEVGGLKPSTLLKCGCYKESLNSDVWLVSFPGPTEKLGIKPGTECSHWCILCKCMHKTYQCWLCINFFLQFTLCLPWKDQQVLSEPVMLPTKKEEKSKDGKDKDHPTPLKVVLCNDKSSTNQV